MPTRGTENRLRKLEGAGRPADVFFLVWGRDDEEIERGLSNERAIGMVNRGDTVIRARWPGPNGTPASR